MTGFVNLLMKNSLYDTRDKDDSHPERSKRQWYKI